MKSTSNDGQKAPEKKNDSRWWEFYFVRYLVGTAVGAIFVLFLAKDSGAVSICQGEVVVFQTLKLAKFHSGYVTIAAILGFVYCYFASAPILVFHAVRGCYLPLDRKNNGVHWFVVVLSVLALFCLIAALYFEIQWGSDEIHRCYVIMAFLLACVIFVSQLPIFPALLGWINTYTFKYYDQIAIWRGSANTAKEEYIESYRHLRENGNAFFIVLLEFLLWLILSNTPPKSWFIILALWIFPAALIWLFGQLLESRRPTLYPRNGCCIYMKEDQ